MIELQKMHARRGITIAVSYRINGVLLDEHWCQFLAGHRWPVGISIDGPAVAPSQPCAQPEDHQIVASSHRERRAA